MRTPTTYLRPPPHYGFEPPWYRKPLFYAPIASAAILLGAAACLAGLDPARMNALPEVPDGRREAIVVRSQRNMYDRLAFYVLNRYVIYNLLANEAWPGGSLNAHYNAVRFH